MVSDIKALWDVPVAIGSITSPFWIPWFDSAAHVFFVLGGVILLCFRLASAYRAWQRGR